VRQFHSLYRVCSRAHRLDGKLEMSRPTFITALPAHFGERWMASVFSRFWQK